MTKAIGFKKMTTAVLDESFKVTKTLEIKGEADKGATRSFSMEGLTADMVKTYGSNKAYRVSKKGIGDLKASMSAIDVPLEFDQAVMGLMAHEEGKFLVGGANTEAPYCATLFEDENAQGQPIAFALFRGAWAKNSIEGETTEGDNKELSEEQYEMTCVVNGDDHGYGIAVGTEQVEALRAYTFPAAATVPEG